MALATAIFAPFVVRDVILGRKTSHIIRRMVLVSYLAGIFAMIPNILRMIGAPEPVYTHIAMNIFILHPLIDSIKIYGGMLIGEVLFISSVAAQYFLLLFALKISSSRHFFTH
jgi:hypothetical protein